jgi:hypothetical protein
MRSRMRTAWPLVLALLVLALSLLGCGSVLGIEELSSESGDASAGEPDDGGSGGKGGRSGSAGRSGSGAGQSGAGNGGNAGAAGKAGAGGSAADAGMDADVAGAGGSGGSSAGAGGSGGTDAPDSGMPDTGMSDTTTVSGKVIDYYRNPVKDVAIKIGNATTTTNAAGEFTVADVSASYDVALTITAKRYGGTEIAGWLFMGLTRRDPTLQVYRGQSLVSGNVEITTNNVFPIPADDAVSLAFGSPWGEHNVSPSAMQYNPSMSWEGPDAINGTVHALRWSNASAAPRNPAMYRAHQERALSLNVTTAATVTFDLDASGAPLASAQVAGTITAPSFAQRTNTVHLRYTDNAAIQLVNEYDAPDTYSYLVPSAIANTSVVVAATVNTPGYTPFAVAYKDGVTPGATGVTLDVPSPATPLTPGGGTSNVTNNNLFTWTGPDQVYVFHVENANFYEGYYVVTTAKEARIPSPPVTNLPLQANGTYRWDVSTHLPRASVDEAAGPEGFLDAYCYGGVYGPSRGHGSHTVSARLQFTTAP